MCGETKYNVLLLLDETYTVLSHEAANCTHLIYSFHVKQAAANCVTAMKNANKVRCQRVLQESTMHSILLIYL